LPSRRDREVPYGMKGGELKMAAKKKAAAKKPAKKAAKKK
jgi:hypothetical protein